MKLSVIAAIFFKCHVLYCMRMENKLSLEFNRTILELFIHEKRDDNLQSILCLVKNLWPRSSTNQQRVLR